MGTPIRGFFRFLRCLIGSRFDNDEELRVAEMRQRETRLVTSTARDARIAIDEFLYSIETSTNSPQNPTVKKTEKGQERNE